jgi:hypothetical protein
MARKMGFFSGFALTNTAPTFPTARLGLDRTDKAATAAWAVSR